MRLFVAIDLDDSAREAIAALQRSLATAIHGERSLKWVNPARMHLTLAFLGEIAAADVPAIIDVLSTDIGVRPVAAEFRGLGVFPPRGAPSVLWLGVAEGTAAIAEVHRVVAQRLSDAGVALERRPFHPHLTLARWRDARAAAGRRAIAADPGTAIARLRVDHVTLYQSRLLPAAPVYTALARATLT